MKMTLRKIREIHAALVEIGRFKAPIGYAVNKNIMIAERVMKDYDKIREDLMVERAVKDADGKAVKTLYSFETNLPADIDIDVNDAEAKIPHGYYVGYLFEDLDETKKLVDAILDEEHDVIWHQIAASKCEACDVPGILFGPLNDCIIIEGI